MATCYCFIQKDSQGREQVRHCVTEPSTVKLNDGRSISPASVVVGNCIIAAAPVGAIRVDAIQTASA